MTKPTTQTGPLADLKEIPWGTPDADELLRLLGDIVSAPELNVAAASGQMRYGIEQVVADAPAPLARALTELADRPQKVRHAFRGALDWSNPAVWDVHGAFVATFGEGAEDLCRLAGLDLSDPELDLDRPASDLWTTLMDLAARQCSLERLLEVAAANLAIDTHQPILEDARSRPWRTEEPVSASEHPSYGRPVPSIRPAPGRPVPARSPLRSDEGPAPRSSLPWLVAFGFVLVGLVGAAAAAWWWKTSVPPVRSVALGGSVELDGATGRLVLIRSGERVAVVPAGATFAFPAEPLDQDGDGKVDRSWGVQLEITSSPCPPRTLDLGRDHPTAQHWTVPVAHADQVDPDGEGPDSAVCRVRVSGLPGLAEGSVVALDPQTVEPRRFAVIDRVEDGRAEGAAAGSWGGCEACWPVPATAEETTSVKDRLAEAAPPPEPVVEPVVEPPPEPPAPEPPKPAPVHKPAPATHHPKPVPKHHR